MQEAAGWTKKERLLFKKLESPEKIQGYLNRMEYDPEYECRSLRKADKDLIQAGLIGAKKAGLYKPKKRM